MALSVTISAPVSGKMSEQEYLDSELRSEVKREYIDGSVYAMAGVSKNHNLISQNISYKLGETLRNKQSPCNVFSADMKVRISHKSTRYYYPDVVVACDNNDNAEYYLNSPVIIVEVLSKSTHKNDKTSKKLAYFNIPTLQEYVIIEQHLCAIEVFRRNQNWQSTLYFLGDSITFESIGVTVSVEDIYYHVNNEEMVDYLKAKSPEEAEQPE